MKSFAALSSIFAGAALFACSVKADASTVDPIITKGKHFFYKTNQTEFFIRGVAYQQDYNTNGTAASNADYTDPLADVDACNRDIPYLVKLRTNVIRTYAVNPDLDHSGCMNAFADAGIYIISDLSAPLSSINRNTPSWDVALYDRYTSLIQDLSQYNNVIGFFAGNEVSNSANTTAASAYVKAAVRDSKLYIKEKVSRPMYVGYASYDGDIRDQLADYFNCGDQTDAIDFWGYNVYSWCGDSSYSLSGYDERTDFFRDYSVPAFFAEYGCNQVEPRVFTEVPVLFGPLMEGVWSGGIVYMYFQESNNYGLVTVDGNSVTTRQDFDNLSSQMAKVSPSSTAFSAVNTATLSPASCPTVDSVWLATSSPLPYRPSSDLCNCIEDTLQCIVKPSTDDTAYGDFFGYICGLQNGGFCRGILSNATTGSYGAFEMCNPEQQLSFVMNNYYQNQKGSNPSACAFSGAATTQEPASATGVCSTLLAAAGSNGGGSVPTALSPGTTASATGNNAAAGLTVPSIDRSLLYLGLYVLGAVGAGAGMLVL